MAQRITPSLWFDGNAEEAVDFYTSVFPNSKITGLVRHPESGMGKPGSVMTISFELDGERFVAINGGPQFKFNEAISLEISCEPGEEQDHYWDRLGEGGEYGPCGWLKDRYGLSWQVVPRGMDELFSDPDPERADRAMQAMLKQGKLDIEEIRRAADGVAA